ncbi:hypothetical protein BKA62DRAFT_719542 [Auriculariales sp. MPI-PUGE-AT-0066]|nr:hypothetical protein BKA62DRAFT_719542 [Auriculariales sp. MPI-PUGE-AT-0066]
MSRLFSSPHAYHQIDINGRPLISLADLEQQLPPSEWINEQLDSQCETQKLPTAPSGPSRSSQHKAKNENNYYSLDRCPITNRPDDYMRLTTESHEPLSLPTEEAGPLNGQLLTISNALGNLRVHIHDAGVQVWVLTTLCSTPIWEPMLTPEHPHPRLEGYILGFKKGRSRPTWILRSSNARYNRA